MSASLGAFGLWAALCLTVGSAFAACPLNAEEHIYFYSAVGYQQAIEGDWTVTVHGRLTHDPASDGATAEFAKSVGFTIEERSSDGFAARARPFVELPLRKSIELRVGTRTYPAKVATDGAFEAQFKLSPREVIRFKREAADGIDRVPVALAGCDDAAAASLISLIPLDGFSVLTDFDDTLKITHADDAKEALKNNFVRPYLEIEGMSAVYQGWSSRGALFHYLSDAPEPLLPAFESFERNKKLPPGIFELRHFHGGDVRRFYDLKERDEEADARHLLDIFPHRRFVLVGNTLRRDPEIFAALARQYPTQVMMIYIRDARSQGDEQPRLQRAFRGVPTERWQVFKDPAELKPIF